MQQLRNLVALLVAQNNGRPVSTERIEAEALRHGIDRQETASALFRLEQDAHLRRTAHGWLPRAVSRPDAGLVHASRVRLHR